MFAVLNLIKTTDMRYVLFMICITFLFPAKSQIKNFYNKGKVGTVQFFRQGFPLSFPAIEFKGGDFLELRFDAFTDSREDLFYSIELCDYNWSPVDINPFDYLEGFFENTFKVYSNSINTTVDYVQYRLIIPNSDIKITKSGNYVLGIYRDSERIDTVVMQRFIVFEDIVSTQLIFDKFQSEILVDKQELNVVFNPGSITMNELSGNIKLLIIQNNDWNTSKTFDSYSLNVKGEIEFSKTGQIVFNGCNEFRFFDSKSLKHYSERVSYVRYEAPYMNIYLKPDKLRGEKEYFYKEDLNGIYFIDNTDTDDEDIVDADYANVHFTLETGYPLPADVFIYGAITNWEFSDNYMEYNTETGNYEKTLLLKQGLYNYRYVLKEFNSNKYFTDVTEGDFYQTVNNYMAIVYYRPLGDLYYKPVGITTFTSNLN